MTIRVRAHVPAMAALAAGLIALGSTADAAPGYVVDGVNLRAGPGVEYPLVQPLPPGTPAEIFGCLPGWTWCDIAVNGPDGDVRGWAAGPRLQLAYNGQPVALPQYGPQFGLPIIGFDVDSYWGTYYRGEPWFGDRGRWRGDFHGGPGYGGGPGGDRARGPGGFAGDGRGEYRGPGGAPGGVREGGGQVGGFVAGARPVGGEPGGFRPGAAPGAPHPGGGHPPPAPAPQGGHAENHGGNADHRPN